MSIICRGMELQARSIQGVAVQDTEAPYRLSFFYIEVFICVTDLVYYSTESHLLGHIKRLQQFMLLLAEKYSILLEL